MLNKVHNTWFYPLRGALYDELMTVLSRFQPEARVKESLKDRKQVSTPALIQILRITFIKFFPFKIII